MGRMPPCWFECGICASPISMAGLATPQPFLFSLDRRTVAQSITSSRSPSFLALPAPMSLPNRPGRAGLCVAQAPFEKRQPDGGLSTDTARADRVPLARPSLWERSSSLWLSPAGTTIWPSTGARTEVYVCHAQLLYGCACLGSMDRSSQGWDGKSARPACTG